MARALGDAKPAASVGLVAAGAFPAANMLAYIAAQVLAVCGRTPGRPPPPAAPPSARLTS